MPLAKIHVLEGQYDEARLDKVSSAVQNTLINALGIPPEDFFQIHSHSAEGPIPSHALIPGAELFG